MKSVGLPDTVWGRLATTADARGVSVEDLLVAAITEVVKPQSRQERVLEAVRAGLSDAVVAERTGELKQYVGVVRRRAGLPANRQKRTDTE